MLFIVSGKMGREGLGPDSRIQPVQTHFLACYKLQLLSASLCVLLLPKMLANLITVILSIPLAAGVPAELSHLDQTAVPELQLDSFHGPPLSFHPRR